LTIGDAVFFDANANGSKNPGEPGIPGVTVTLTGAGPDGIFGNVDDVTATTTTNSNGAYLFTNMAPGLYRVDIGSTPNGLNSPTYDLDGTATPSNATFLTVSGNDRLDVDFGYQGTASIGDTVYVDFNGNGIQDAGEGGMANITVNVLWHGFDGVPGGGDDVIFITNTNTSGNYAVSNLPLGEYRVFVNPATVPAGFDPISDPDGVGSPHSATLSLTTAAPIRSNVDFGYRGTGEIGDTVYVDLNGNSTQDVGEPGLPGAPITLTYAGTDGVFGTPDDSLLVATTGAAGTYSFINLPPGIYRVTVGGLLPGLTNTQDPDGGADSKSLVSLANGEVNKAVDFGYQGDRSFGDRVWNDLNGDGIQDANEPGLLGVDINVVGAGFDGVFGTFDDIVYPVVRTGIDGKYMVNGLPGDNYRASVISATLPASLVPSFDLDSGTVGADGITTIDLRTTTQNLNVDYGYRGPGAIGDRVWYDLNRDGSDVGEPGIAGTKVNIAFAGGDGIFGTNDDVLYGATTDANGNYGLTGLPTGKYRVSVDPTSLPADLIPTFDADSGTSNPDQTADVILTTNNPTTGAIDFGYTGKASVGDRVWNDVNGDGIQDANEPGLTGIQIIATWAGPDGIIGSADDASVTVTTGANGQYSIGNLPAGTYRVQLSGGLPGSPANTFDLDGVADGRTDVAVTSLQQRTDVDFGVRGTASLSGNVYRDDSNDGIQNPGEPGLPGVTITVSGVDERGNAVTVSTTTDANGTWTVGGLLAGTYTIVETQPANVSDGLDAVGTIGGVAVGTLGNDMISNITLGAGETGINYNFGELAGEVSGRVYVDSNRNGVLDPGETGLGGVIIRLRDSVGNVVRTTTTQPDGSYLIRGFPPGDYVVEEEQPIGYGSSTPNTRPISVIPGTSVTGIDFGETLASISGFVYRDLSVDGLRDPGLGETGIGGVTVTLAGTNILGNSVNRTAVTRPDGTYSFDLLFAGTYTLTESQPQAFFYDGLDSVGNLGGNAGNDVLTLALAGGDQGLEYNFGENPPADPFGYVYEDLNNNGVRDPGEPGIAGVPIRVEGIAFGGTPMARPLTAADVPGGLTVYTDSTGRYEFALIPPGTYSLTEVFQPVGYADGREHNGDPNTPATVIVGNDRFDNIVLRPSPIRGPFNFGEIRLVTAGGVTKRDYLGTTTTATVGVASPIQPATSPTLSWPAVGGLNVGPGAPDCVLAVGADAGTAPIVRVFDYAMGGERWRFMAFDPAFQGGVRVAVGDVTGDGVMDIIAAAGAGGGPHVRVFDGATGQVVRDFFAYDQSFRGGVFVASGDVNGDGFDDIITGAGVGGGPHVRIWDGKTGAEIGGYFAYDMAFRGGVHVAAGDIDGDGVADVITGAGESGGAHVRVFQGATSLEIMGFFAYDLAFRGGVWVAAGDVDGDGRADIITGPGVSGGPQVRVFNGVSGAGMASFLAYDPGFVGGVRVAAIDANGDGRAEVFTGPGPSGTGQIRAFDGANGQVLDSFWSFDSTLIQGVFIG
jgi:hypothetical protein